jgi:flagellar biosynthetic protein FlhB
MFMSEDRTQPPSKRRRQLARGLGQVAHSPELTAAAGLLAAVGTLGLSGGALGQALLELVRSMLAVPPVMPADPGDVIARVRGLLSAMSWPLGTMLAGFAAGAVVAHQLQVRGLWATGLIVPDPARLWVPGREPGQTGRAGRAAWAMVKAAVLVMVAIGLFWACWNDILMLGALEGPKLTRSASRLVLVQGGVLGGVLLALGLVDYGFRYFRFESMLRTTPQEHREDQRMMEGDPITRAQRRRMAQAWRADSPDLLAGASLIVQGPGGLTVVLSGGPPPRRVTVRAVGRGETGLRLRRLAGPATVDRVEAGELARSLGRRAVPGRPIPADRIAELAAIWPPR